MSIEHGLAIALETTVRSVAHCERYGYGGLVDADLYEIAPLEAAIMCVALLYQNKYDDEISEFFRKWRYVFDCDEDNIDTSPADYISELNSLILLLRT